MSKLKSAKRRALSLAASGALVAAALVGCSAGGESPSGEPTEPQTVESLRLLVTPTLDSALIYYALEKGIFDEHGLDVTPTVGTGGAAIIASVQAGETDIGLVNSVGLFSSLANGVPLSVVAPITKGGIEYPGLFVMPDSGIDAISDLKGRNIGVNATGSFGDLTTNIALEAAGLSPADVNYVVVPIANLNSALTTGQVDAVVQDQPSAQSLEAEGARLLHSSFTGDASDLPIGLLAASDSWVSSNPDVIAKFRSALEEAVTAAETDPSGLLAVVPSYMSVSSEVLEELVVPAYFATISASELQRIPDLLLQYGLLSSPLDAESVLVP